MKKHILITLIILFSMFSGFIWALFFQMISSWNVLEDFDNTWVSQNITLTDLQSSITQVAKDISPSVVSIIIKKDMIIYRSDPWGFFQQAIGSVQREVWGWSWFFIRKDGIILTNKHVISDRNAEYTVVLNNGEEYDVKILGYVENTDLALIQIQDSMNEFPALQIRADTQETEIWSFAIAIWNALAQFQNSVSFGIISGKNRTIQAEWEKLTGLIQTDAAINPGNSWGPLINLNWDVIWVNTAIAAWAEGVWFAIELNSEMIQWYLDEIK
jgi:serine protease Do